MINGTSGNDTFAASILQNAAGNLADSFQSIDIIDGGDGSDTLTVQTQGGGAVAPTVKNVETIKYTAFTAQDYNMVNTSGVTKLVNSGSIVNLTASNVSNVVDLEVEGVVGNSTIIQYAAAAVAGTADTQKIVFNKATNDHSIRFDAAVNGIETLDITSTGAANKVKIDNADGVTKLVIGGDQALTLGFLATVDSPSGLKTVDASAATGNLTLDLSTNVAASNLTVTGGKGNDKVTVDNFNKDDKIDLGEGDDTLIINAADGVIVASVDIKNTEILQFKLNTDTDDASEDYSYNLSGATALTTVKVGATTAATKTNQQNLTLSSLAATAKTLELNGDGAAADTDLNKVVWNLANTAGTTQTLDIKVSNKDANGNLVNTTKGVQLTGDVTANGIETITLTTDKLHADTNATTQDGGLKMALAADKLQKLTVVSETLVDLSGADMDNSVREIDASAASGGVILEMDVAADADNTVAANKSVTVTTGAGNDQVKDLLVSVNTTVNTGAGNDTITLKGNMTASMKLVIDAGDGNDTVNLSADATANEKEITLGAGVDTIVINTAVAGIQSGITVMDFVAGNGGDVIDLTNAANDIVVGGTTGETKYVEVAGFTNANSWGGMNVLTTAIATLDQAGVRAGLNATKVGGAGAVAITDGDVFYLIASNGVDAGLFQVKDGGADTTDAAEVTLVGTFKGISDASAFAVQNFADFLA